MRGKLLQALLVGACVLLLPPAAASAKSGNPGRHDRNVRATVVKVTPHAVIIRIALGRDDANLLCQSDLRTTGLRAFILHFARHHDLPFALARCIGTTGSYRPALLERASGTSTLTSTTISVKSTAANVGTVSVPAGASLNGTITSGHPLATGTAAVTLSADWSKRRANGVAAEMCAPATGTATFTGSTARSTAAPAAPGTITMSITGSLCTHTAKTTIPSTSGNAAFFAGAYTVTAATGVGTATTAAGSIVGHGRIALSIAPNGATSLVAVGGLRA